MLAIITGVTGQDGSYLSEFLLDKKYTVIGLTRRTSSPNTSRIEQLLKNSNFYLKEYDITDIVSIIHIFKNLPTYSSLEIYNLAAQSHVMSSFHQAETTTVVNGLGPLRLLEAIRLSEIKNVKFYQASTSEMFGKAQEFPQTETTQFYPRNPYGVSKLYAHWIVKNYRENYNMFACNGILFNHESERRGEEFVTRKITLGLSKILKDPNFVLKLGNLHSKRDWGHAEDYVYGMWLMLQHDIPDDYVLSSDNTHTILEFIETAFSMKGISIRWDGLGQNMKGYDSKSSRLLVEVDPSFYRPVEVDILVGNSIKARTVLGWTPKHDFINLVKRMVDSDTNEAV